MPPPEPRELTNLRAFARLYGVLRFFHPSDEAAALDWNRYAVLGVARVRGARDAVVRSSNPGWTSVTQSIDAVPYRGKPFQLRAHARIASRAEVGAWARVDRTGGVNGFEDGMASAQARTKSSTARSK